MTFKTAVTIYKFSVLCNYNHLSIDVKCNSMPSGKPCLNWVSLRSSIVTFLLCS